MSNRPIEINSFIQKCQVPGCNANSPSVVVYSAKKSRNFEKYNRWISILKIPESRRAVVYACQRHFPAGAPTLNNPDPSPKLFNPIPKVSLLNDASEDTGTAKASLLTHTALDKEEKIIGPDGNLLPSAIYPPPGSVVKLAPNATLIDLKKIKEEQDLSRPIRIEEVTVLIDEKDSVKVVDYGPRKNLNQINGTKLKKEGRSNRRAWLPISWDDPGNFELHNGGEDEPHFRDFEHPSLGFVLEQMRQLRIDCNMAIVDVCRKNCVFAHRSVLVARSPYFYRQLYLKRKKHKNLFEFSRFTLPVDVDFDTVDAVVSFIYTGSFDLLLGKNSSTVKELLCLFELKKSLKAFAKLAEERTVASETTKTVKIEPSDEAEEGSVMVLPFEENEEERSTPVIEVSETRTESERKRKKRTNPDPSEVGVQDFGGKLKVSVQKIVENALIPLVGKIEEMFSSPNSTLQISRTSQNITTLWQADILLIKLFDQSDLIDFFSDVMGTVLDKSLMQLKKQSVDTVETESCSYNVETLYTQTGDPIIDETYSKPYIGGSIENSIDQTMQSITVDIKIMNYSPLSSKHIPKYVHLIALYRFNISMKKKCLKLHGNESGKDSIIPTLLEAGDLQEDSNNASHDLDNLMKRLAQEEYFFTTPTQGCFQKIIIDLKRRVIADLELYINPSFHEELIMHIIVGQLDDKNVFPFSVGIFLAKGCNFCRKKECRAEDLTIPISTDNPVCPDRECIKRNLHCDICNKQMSTSKSLARHKYSVHNIDTGDSNGIFICSHCGETYSKKWKLNIHERDHEDRKIELMCSYCKKKIRGSMALKKHITMVHETKAQFSCDYCNKVFKRRETLYVHRRIHTGEKPFRCRQCDYASETKGNLKAHVARKHKVQIIPSEHAHVIDGSPLTDNIEEQGQGITEEINSQSDGMTVGHVDDQVMAATIVAHPLSDGSFIITSETSDMPMDP